MIKKTVTYTDYNGTERTESYYFHLSRTELIDMEYGVDGGLSGMLQGIASTKDQAQLIKFSQKLILASYGEKSDDGRRFIKSKELSEAFSQTEAYNEIFMELATDDKKAAEFVNGILPANVTPNASSNAAPVASLNTAPNAL